MIITKNYAKRLIHQGKAGNEGQLKPDDKGRVYIAIDRYDKQRVDHYLEI